MEVGGVIIEVFRVGGWSVKRVVKNVVQVLSGTGARFILGRFSEQTAV